MDLSKLLDPVSLTLAGAGLPTAETPAAPRRLTIGVGDTAKPAVLAALAREATAPTLIVSPKSSRVADLYDELAHWLGPDARRLRLYPQRDLLPYERAPDDPWDIRARLETIASLHTPTSPATMPGDTAKTPELPNAEHPLSSQARPEPSRRGEGAGGENAPAPRGSARATAQAPELPNAEHPLSSQACPEPSRRGEGAGGEEAPPPRSQRA